MNLSGAPGNIGERGQSIVWTPSSELVEAADPQRKWIQNFPPPSSSRCEELGAIWRTLGLSKFASTDFRGMDAEALKEYWSRMQLTDSGVLVRERGDRRPAVFKTFDEIRRHFQFPDPFPTRQCYAAVEKPKEAGRWTQYMDAREVGRKPLSASKFVGAEMRVWMSWGVQWFRGNHHHGRYSKADLNIAWAIFSKQLQPLDAIIGLLQRKSSQHGCTGAALAGHILAHPFMDAVKAQIRDCDGAVGSETEVLTVAADNVGGAVRECEGEDIGESVSAREKGRRDTSLRVKEKRRDVLTDGADNVGGALRDIGGEDAVGSGGGRKRGRGELVLELQVTESTIGVAGQETVALARRESAAAVLVALSRGDSSRKAARKLSDPCPGNSYADCAAVDPIGEGASTTVHSILKDGDTGNDDKNSVQDAATEVDECLEVDKDMDSDAEFPRSQLELLEVRCNEPLDAEAVPLEVVLELPPMESVSEASSLGQADGFRIRMHGVSKGNVVGVINTSWNESVDSCPKKAAFASPRGAVQSLEKGVGSALKDPIQESPRDAIQTPTQEVIRDLLKAPTDVHVKTTTAKPAKLVTKALEDLVGESADKSLNQAGETLMAIDSGFKSQSCTVEVGFPIKSDKTNRTEDWLSRGEQCGDWMDEFCMDTQRLKQQLLSWERKGHSNPAMILDP